MVIMLNTQNGRSIYSRDRNFIHLFIEKREIWSNKPNVDESIVEFYSQDFRDFINNMWGDFVSYTTGSSITENEILRSKKQLALFTVKYLNSQNLMAVYAAMFGYNGLIGLDYGIGLAKTVEKTLGKLPTARELKDHLPGILNAINNGYWHEFGIKKGSYNDFLQLAFGQIHQKSHTRYKDENGLLIAKNEIQQYSENLGGLPTYKQVAAYFGGIINAINEGYWTEFGLDKGSFNAFLKFCFGEVNQHQKKKGIYKWKQGLKLAQSQVKTLYEKTGKLPTRKMVEKQFRGIIYAIKNGYWLNFDIRKGNFNDFLMVTFGQINKRSNGFYQDQKGLMRAIRQYKSLQRILGKQPAYNDIYQSYGGIITGINNGYWKEFGITTFSNFAGIAEKERLDF